MRSAWGKAWGYSWGVSWGMTRQDAGSLIGGYRIDRTKPIDKLLRNRKQRSQDILLLKPWTL